MFIEIWSDLRYRVRALLRRGAAEQDLDEELQFHLECEARKYEAAGVPREEARRRARLVFGGIDQIKEDSRDRRGTRLLEEVVQDVRYAFRGLRARPAFTAVIVITLALGVGVNAAMFGVLDSLLFRAPAFLIDPPNVHRVYAGWDAQGRRITERTLEYPTYVDLARWSTAFSGTAAFSYRDEAIGTGEAVEERVVAAVSSSFFDFFSARPVLGRFFVAQEDQAPLGSAVAVLAHSYWRSQFGGRADVLGTIIRIGRESYTVIGVAPRNFTGVSDHRSPVGFVPITRYGSTMREAYSTRYNWSWVDVLGRRKPGVTIEAATADLTNAFRRSWAQWNPSAPSRESPGPSALAGSIHLARGPQAGPESKVVKWLSGVALVVLLIACANVANLLLAHGRRRRRELVLRAAIGGTRARIARQLLTETLTLAALGGAGGLLGAYFGGSALRRLFLNVNDAIDGYGAERVLIFAVGMTLAAALIAGLVPAFHSGKVDLADSLKAGMREAPYRRSRVRSALLIVQTALSVILLVGAGLFVRSLYELRSVRLGYDVEPIMYVQARYRVAPPDNLQRAELIRRLVEEARAIPGVMNATPVISVPFIGGERQSLFVPGRDSVQHLGRFSLQAGTPDYFTTVGTRILRGRGIAATDLPNTPRVAVVSEAMAQVLWPGRNAIGQCFRIRSDTVPCTTVVGIAENVRMHSLTAPAEFTYYLPATQYPLIRNGAPTELLVRVDGRAGDFAVPIRRALQRIMTGTSYVNVAPLEQLVSPVTRSWQVGATLFLLFGLLALTLATIGLYSVIALGVTQRRHEIGVRIALGAGIRDVLHLVVGEGIRLAATGILIGCGIALLANRWLTPLLFEVSPRDPAVYLVVTLSLLAVAVLASTLPAARAAAVDPNIAFKAE